tara:strand:+ start:252 stop:395 length:144 start_codon:yes stop_codon:yes gene_type:complete
MDPIMKIMEKLQYFFGILRDFGTGIAYIYNKYLNHLNKIGQKHEKFY